MKIAYIILAHKNPEQLLRLISRLKTNNTSFFIRVDQKTDRKVYQQIVERMSVISNVSFLKRYKCFWGNFRIVQATIEGIKKIVDFGIDFDYVVLLSGQDYLIKPTEQAELFLQKNKGKEFINFFSLTSSNKWEGQPYDGFNRTRYWHFRLRSKHFCLPIKRNFPKGFQPYGGSQWWCLSRKCIEYINSFIAQNQEFVDYFKHVYIPDESFFQTIVLNSPFKDQVINDDLRYIDWEKHNPFPPGILGKSDFEQLTISSKLFARKFDITRDADILDMLDRKILNLDLNCSKL